MRKIPNAGNSKYSGEQLKTVLGNLERLVDNAKIAEGDGKPTRNKLCIEAVGDSGVCAGTLVKYVWNKKGTHLPDKFKKWAARILNNYRRIGRRIDGSFKFTDARFENTISYLEKRVEGLEKGEGDNKPSFLDICKEAGALPEANMNGMTLCRYITVKRLKARIPKEFRKRAAAAHKAYEAIEKRCAMPDSQKYSEEQFRKAVDYLEGRISRLEKNISMPLPSFTNLCKGAKKVSGIKWRTISEYLKSEESQEFIPGSLQPRAIVLYARYLELDRKKKEMALNHVEGRLTKIRDGHLPLEYIGVMCDEAAALTGMGGETIRERYILNNRSGRRGLPNTKLQQQAARIDALYDELKDEKEVKSAVEKAKKTMERGEGSADTIRIGKREVNVSVIFSKVWVDFQLSRLEQVELVYTVENDPRYAAAKERLGTEAWWEQLKKKARMGAE